MVQNRKQQIHFGQSLPNHSGQCHVSSALSTDAVKNLQHFNPRLFAGPAQWAGAISVEFHRSSLIPCQLKA